MSGSDQFAVLAAERHEADRLIREEALKGGNAVERNAAPKIGALFFEDDGEIKFQYTSDASSIIGPRKATEQDKKDHAIAWAAFLETRGDQSFPQLDHDGDGRAGGSLPGPRRGGRRKKVIADDLPDDRSADV